jgi:hypothetical protein
MKTGVLSRSLVLSFATAALVVSLPASPAAQLRFLEITNPPHFGLTPSDVSPVYTYEWRTLAGSADPAEMRLIFLSTQPFNSSYAATLAYIRQTPDAPEWSPWMPYSPPNVGTSWTSPPMEFGGYVLAVQGRDAMGVVEPEIDETRNAVRLRIAMRVNGPLLTVTGDLISPIVTTTIVTPLTEITVGGGTPVSFCWTADASAYGGFVAGYRYQWDLTDPDDDSQWGTGFIPFPTPSVCSTPVAFLAGAHMFHVEVVDNSGYKSRVPILVHVIPTTPVEQKTWGGVKALYSAGRSRP